MKNFSINKCKIQLTGVIDLSKINPDLLSKISQYFIPVYFKDRYFLEDEEGIPIEVHTINLSGIDLGQTPTPRNVQRLLRPYYPSGQPIPYFPKVCDLIADNIGISTLNLSNTNLDDVAGAAICKALKNNTHLTEIILDNNPYLSETMKEKINKALKMSYEGPITINDSFYYYHFSREKNNPYNSHLQVTENNNGSSDNPPPLVVDNSIYNNEEEHENTLSMS